jgi:hypothetical protein
LNLLQFTFQNLIPIHQEKLIIKHGQKSFQTSHFKLYAVLKRGYMEAFSRYHFSIIEIVGFDNIKCIPILVFPTTIDYSLLTLQMCQNLDRSINGKYDKMCSITTRFGGGNE